MRRKWRPVDYISWRRGEVGPRRSEACSQVDAKRMKAKTSEVKSSHLPLISHAQTVAALIEEAASASPR